MEELSLIDFIEGMQPEKAKVAKPEIPELTVSEISFEIKRFVETAFGKVRVRGEIFGAKRADSGHYYLSLKDENAVLSAVCWKGVAAQLAVKPEDGLEVVATGKVTTFAGKSSYQLVIEQMEVAGTGALLKLLEERKKQYADEGLFDAAKDSVSSESGGGSNQRQRCGYSRHYSPNPRPVSAPCPALADAGAGRRSGGEDCGGD